jgi:hypothetical protein
MHDDPANELQSVIQRFREAVDSLGVLKERLMALELAQETQARSADSIGAASRALAGHADELGSLTVQLRGSCAATDSAMSAARRFLDGSDLSTLLANVESLRQEVGDHQRTTVEHLQTLSGVVTTDSQTTESLVSMVSRLQERLDGEVAGARKEAAAALDARHALEVELQSLRAKVQAIPEKHRRKFGL